MKIIYFWKPLLWLVIICYALFIPAHALPLGPFCRIPYFDKMVHFGLFFVFCLLLLRPFKRLQLKHYLLAPLISIILSALLEFSQHVLSNSRSSDIKDFIANSMGVIAAVVFFYLFVSNRKWEKLF
ncbi:MAG: VanZ family protein [Draconibacterium sp.]|nr:VanZ family protein [Draconibacterium sp.]